VRFVFAVVEWLATMLGCIAALSGSPSCLADATPLPAVQGKEPPGLITYNARPASPGCAGTPVVEAEALPSRIPDS